MKVADAHTVGWMLWSFDKNNSMGVLNPDGSEKPILNTLVRVYPRAIGGSDARWSITGNSFVMSWKKIVSVTAPTEIFVPPRFHNIRVFVNGVERPYKPSPARPNIQTVMTTDNDMSVQVTWS